MKNFLLSYFKSNWIFVLILVIGFLFRIVAIGNIPPSPSLDEVSIGYNAYSILHTGADEYGEKFPVLLRAYDDWRPALYVYFVIPFVKFLGLTVESVRLPSVSLSIASLGASFFLFYELLRSNMKNEFKVKDKKYIAYVSLFFFSISPWHIYFSRIGHEWNGALSFFIIATSLFFLYLRPRKNRVTGRILLALSFVCFSLSFSFYQSSKIFIPVILGTLVLLYLKKLLDDKRGLFIAGTLGILFAVPIVLSLLGPRALVRYSATNIYRDSSNRFEKSAERVLAAKQEGDILGQIINNRRIVYLQIPLEAYVSHFQPEWLFGNADGGIFKVPKFGLLFLFELPLILLGIIAFFAKKNITVKIKVFMAVWLFVSILPGALTTGFPHAARIFNILPLPHFIAAIGLYYFASYARKLGKTSGLLFLVIAVIIIIFSLVKFLLSYFVLFPKEYASQFQYGALEAMSYVVSVNRETVVVQEDSLNQAYMYYLFFTKKDPVEYQKSNKKIDEGFVKHRSIDGVEFVDSTRTVNRDALYVIDVSDELSVKLNVEKTIYLPNGKPQILIGTIK